MIASFFQSLDRHGVESLLISGQAAVLYGAATFSEDIDLWINPTEANRARFLAVLHENRACYYQVTPPFTVEHLQRGHGFHFVLPGARPGTSSSMCWATHRGRGPSPACCPRPGAWKPTGGQFLPSASGLWSNSKKNQRLEDYPVISKLALAWFAQPECAHTGHDLLWALQHMFTLPELARFFAEHPAAVPVAETFHPAVAAFGRHLLAEGEVAEPIQRRVGEFFQARIAELQQADRRYWRDIIRELKALRAAGALMPEGAPVAGGI